MDDQGGAPPEAGFARVRSLFLEACELEGEAREAFLVRVTQGDGAWLQEVRALLAKDEASKSQLRVGLAEELRAATASDPKLRVERIGPHRVLEILGRGGMGIVYLARQDSPAREVAIKVLRPGLVTAKAQRRFEAEIEALARLDHPGIASIYEAGLADLGFGEQPYYVMERVEGASLTDWSKRRSLDESLAMFCELCRAVQHAHERGVVHRDLKPENVLVTAGGRPKVLDFGVARVVDLEEGQTLFTTNEGEVLGTLAYMSPEQVGGERALVDARTDVYALGVILYELLSGRLPHELGGLGLPEAARVIREQDARPLPIDDRQLRGDLETIVQKALEKEHGRRYASAEALAADVDRFLHHEPITARPPSTLYQLGKFTRRHRGLVGGLLSTALVLLAAVIVLSLSSFKLSRSEAHASRRAEIVTSVNEFLERLFTSVDVTGLEGLRKVDVKVVEILTSASAELDSGFEGVPEAEAAVRNMLGAAFNALEQYADAEREYLRARALFEREAPEDSEYLKTLGGLSNLYADTDRLEESLALARERFVLTERIHGERAEETYDARNAIVYPLWELGRAAEAAELLEEWIEPCRRDLGEHHPEYQSYLNNLGTLLVNLGRIEEGVAVAREACRVGAEVLGATHPVVVTSRLNLAVLTRKQPSITEDERRETLEEARFVYDQRLQTYGDEHTEPLWALGMVCGFLYQDGRNEESVELWAELLQRIEELDAADQRIYFENLRKAVGPLLELGRHDQAQDYARRALDGFRSIAPEDSGIILRSRFVLARATLAGGDAAAALGEIDALRAMLLSSPVEGAMSLPELAEARVQCLMRLGREAEARTELESISTDPGSVRAEQR